MLILATFANVIVIPLGVSFFTHEVHYSPTWISLNAIVDFLFIMDLCMNFCTGYWDDENDVSYYIFHIKIKSDKCIKISLL